ncbi:unnamed protein product [Miscanthus lutarioriparius]|uniref:Uncharacterized protein n=1 Tax=Miscanthus lutarioriparius TaxID=422564 RepID=A0A811MPT5_9POAL|nr:unnamed protein product [Miscanthus lutarioriparius]
MSASPEFFKPAAPAFSPACAAQPPLVFAGDDDDYYCKTPTGSRISYLREPTTCPPAPRKPPCRKRLFQAQPQAQGISISVSLLPSAPPSLSSASASTSSSAFSARTHHHRQATPLQLRLRLRLRLRQQTLRGLN